MKKFTTKLKTDQFELDGKVVTLTELTGDQRDDYNDFVRSRMTPNGKQKDGVDLLELKSTKGMDAKVISLAATDSSGKPLKESDIRQWPSKVQDYAATVVRDISGLSVSEEDEAKKD